MKRTMLFAAVWAVLMSLASASAGVAEALSVKCDPSGCKVYCTQTTASGFFVEYEEGTEITVTTPEGEVYKYKCVAGQWVQQNSLVPSAGIFGNISPNNIGPAQIGPNEGDLVSDTDPFFSGPRRPTTVGCDPNTVGCPG